MTLNWGTGIAATYLVFATGTGAFVVFAMSRPVALVSPDYYADSLREDQQLAAIRNAQELSTPPAIVWNGIDRIRVSIPPAHRTGVTGAVTLYRASDVSADRTFDLKISEQGTQDIRSDNLARGLWLVKLRWSVEGREYFFEQPVTLR
jgi:FixH